MVYSRGSGFGAVFVPQSPVNPSCEFLFGATQRDAFPELASKVSNKLCMTELVLVCCHGNLALQLSNAAGNWQNQFVDPKGHKRWINSEKPDTQISRRHQFASASVEGKPPHNLAGVVRHVTSRHVTSRHKSQRSYHKRFPTDTQPPRTKPLCHTRNCTRATSNSQQHVFLPSVSWITTLPESVGNRQFLASKTFTHPSLSDEGRLFLWFVLSSGILQPPSPSATAKLNRNVICNHKKQY